MDNHKQRPWHSLPVNEVYKELNTSKKGLSDAEAQKRLLQNGANELNSKPGKNFITMLKEQFADPMILILITAAIISAVLGEWTEAAVIAIIVITNAVIGIAQEKKAQSALEALRKISAPSARVIRDNEECIVPAKNLAAGDIVCLSDGDMVPADIRLTDSANLKIQEASLTGESVPSEKDTGSQLSENVPLADRINMAYSSSIVTYGRGVGIVTATGMDTQMGKIAGMLDESNETDTPIKKKLNVLGKTLTVIGLIVCVVIFALGALYHKPLIPQFLIAISLAISIIPEGLPATATIIMALGVQRMAKKNALIRKLPAVETLGNATVICSDKTGTLTLNKMTVTEICVNGDFESGKSTPIKEAAEKHPEIYKELVYSAALCNDAGIDPDRENEIIGDPTEGALIQMALKFGIDNETLENKYPRLFEQPFNSERKRMTTVHKINGRFTAYTKGAVDELLELCTHILTSSGVHAITQKDKQNIIKLCLSMSERALRVLGFAEKFLTLLPEDDEENVEYGLTFIGITGMIDPPRKEVAKSVAALKQAGIRTVMITGDHKTTAVAIAKELNIYNDGNAVVSGDELDGITNEELDRIVKNVTVFARVSPSDKLRIIQSLKRVGEVAAMTGDGVNDSPALKCADIGVAMGKSGTDVAKNAADMILLDDSFSTITYAVKEGRRVYKNIQKVIQFLLVGNAAEILTLLIATIFNMPTPLAGIHILWVNLATATLPALALGVDTPCRGIMSEPPAKSGTLFEKSLIIRVLTQGFFVSLLTIAAYFIGLSTGNAVSGQTMAFCVLAFSQMLRAFSQRSNTEPIWRGSNEINYWLIISFFVSAALMSLILFIPAMQNVFQITLLSPVQYGIAAALAIITLVQSELIKAIRRKRISQK
ncbi:MAG: cation-translocating P-type ATPase [Clostridiales bacterium]|nr:cation-translocating P-type ATPase [Clostridiales bacterium]